ncbi:RNA-directed DNA polymerase, eukaryota, reverse transcriptase zinc-binding domain protein [Tanacetum coccineum]
MLANKVLPTRNATSNVGRPCMSLILLMKMMRKRIQSKEAFVSEEISVIHNDMGQRFKGNQVASQFVDHFTKFLGLNVLVSPIPDDDLMFKRRLSMLEDGNMVKEVTSKEIKDAMFSMGDNKAPGPDAQELMKGYDRSGGAKRFSININDENCGFFKRGRGLRQGDPMSPYLFTMVMEFFTLIMERNMENTPEFNYHFGCRRLKVTHICFADDLLVFFHGDPSSVRLIKSSLEEFGSHSGLVPNFNKSTIFFRSINNEDQQCLLDILPFQKGSLPMRYLGVPLITKRLVVKEINSILKAFLWNSGEVSKGKTKIVWKNVCKPKIHGGLGLKDLICWNKALLVKHIWNIANKKDTLWVKWVMGDALLCGMTIGVCLDMIVNGSWKWPRDCLCLKNEESHNHLFYQCDYTKEIWNQLILIMEGSMIGIEWKEIVDSLAAMDSKRSIGNIIRKLCLGASVYFIWQTRMMGLKVKRSNVVCLVAAKWNVKMNFKDSDKGPSRESTSYLGVP